MKFPYIVFCDFDGTISNIETLTDLLYTLKPPGARQYMKEMQSGKITLAEGVKGIFSLIPTSRFEEILEYSKKIQVRPGFHQFLLWLSKNKIPFVLLSGGLLPMVEATVGAYFPHMLGVYTGTLDLTRQYMHFYSPWEDAKEVVEKTKVMQLYQYEKAICIGDGITDIRMAQNSDIVFARDQLAETLTSKNIPFYSWDTFEDITKQLTKSLMQNNE